MIVIVDDDDGARATYEYWLKKAGREVQTAPDGGAALEILNSAPDATVLLDLFMPGMEGIETLGHIRRHYPLSRVIVMSGGRHLNRDMRKFAVKLGADAALEKPFTLDQLLDAIDGVRLDGTC